MKRLLSALLALTLLLTLFAGCSKRASSDYYAWTAADWKRASDSQKELAADLLAPYSMGELNGRAPSQAELDMVRPYNLQSLENFFAYCDKDDTLQDFIDMFADLEF